MKATVDYVVNETYGDNDWFVRIEAVGNVPCIKKSQAEKLASLVNSHDDLVAALKLARNQWLDSIDGHDLSDYQQEALQQIDAALAKAEGGK